MTTHLVAGLDLGSTGVKVLIADLDGTELLIEQSTTPWTDGAGGTTEMTANALLEVVATLLVTTSEKLSALLGGPFSVDAIAVSGMGETGLLVDSTLAALTPAIAWFDPRGQEQVDALPTALRTEFASRTGLPLGVQASIAKILWLRDRGISLRQARWFNLPEYMVAALGGLAGSEYSLASRTGLLDQDSGRPWAEMLEYLGVTPEFLPPLIDAGTDLGVADADWLPSPFVGARVTVAGHDHLVAAVSGGAIAADRYYASFGTAEVLLRVLDTPLTGSARARLAELLINSVRHVVPGQHVLVAGVKTGLLMRRALQLAGVHDRTERDRLDADVLALPITGAVDESALEVCGARNDDGVLRLTIRSDGISPAELFAAILRHGNVEIQRLIEAMDRELPPARSTVLSGGWAGMASVQRARAIVLPGLVVSHRSQDTAFGASVFAARLLPAPSPPARDDFEPPR